MTDTTKTALAVLTVPLLFSGCQNDKHEIQAPPVVLITIDTTRADDLRCYGGPADTPSLSRLSGDGVLFLSTFTVATATTPSHASLFTSLYPAQHRVFDNEMSLSPVHVTLAEVFRAVGYETAAFVSAVPVSRTMGLDQGFDTYDDSFGSDPSLGVTEHSERRADRTCSQFLSWLHRSRPSPFFVWLHFFDPHQPYDPPPSRSFSAGSSTAADTRSMGSFFADGDGRPRYVKAEEIIAHGPTVFAAFDRAARHRYHDEITFMDHHIGVVIDSLKSKGVYDQSIIVIVSDHGENFSRDDPELAFSHAGLRSSVTRLAFVLKLPGQELAGLRADSLVGNIDIAPTILEPAHVRAPEAWSGKSALPLVRRGDRGGFRDHLVVESAGRALAGIRTSEWGYIQPIDRSYLDPEMAPRRGLNLRYDHALFDAIRDREEQRNLVAANPGVVAGMQELIEGHLRSYPHQPVRTIDDANVTEALETLGYVPE